MKTASEKDKRKSSINYYVMQKNQKSIIQISKKN